MVLAWWHFGQLASADSGAINKVIRVLPDLDLQLACLHPKGIPLMFVLVFGAVAPWLDFNAMDGDSVVAEDMLSEAPDLSLSVH